MSAPLLTSSLLFSSLLLVEFGPQNVFFCNSHNISLSWNVKVVVIVSTENKDSNDLALKLQEVLLATIFLES